MPARLPSVVDNTSYRTAISVLHPRAAISLDEAKNRESAETPWGGARITTHKGQDTRDALLNNHLPDEVDLSIDVEAADWDTAVAVADERIRIEPFPACTSTVDPSRHDEL